MAWAAGRGGRPSRSADFRRLPTEADRGDGAEGYLPENIIGDARRQTEQVQSLPTGGTGRSQLGVSSELRRLDPALPRPPPSAAATGPQWPQPAAHRPRHTAEGGVSCPRSHSIADFCLGCQVALNIIVLKQRAEGRGRGLLIRLGCVCRAPGLFSARRRGEPTARIETMAFYNLPEQKKDWAKARPMRPSA